MKQATKEIQLFCILLYHLYLPLHIYLSHNFFFLCFIALFIHSFPSSSFVFFLTYSLPSPLVFSPYLFTSHLFFLLVLSLLFFILCHSFCAGPCFLPDAFRLIEKPCTLFRVHIKDAVYVERIRTCVLTGQTVPCVGLMFALCLSLSQSLAP